MNSPSEATQVPRPALPLARYRVRFREHTAKGSFPLTSPRTSYLGSAWRGAFGHALRKAVCITRLPTCDPCVLLHSCPYPFLFESRTPPGARKLTRYPRTPGPYVLEPSDRRFDSGSDMLSLGLTLFGAANDHLPYVVHALDSAGRRGLTARRVKLEMLDVQAETRGLSATGGVVAGGTAPDDAAEPESAVQNAAEQPGWTTVFELGRTLSPVPAEPPLLPALPTAVRVRLVSPLRIKRHEHLVGPADFDFRAFMGGLLRRISLVTYFFGDTPLETDFAGLLRRAEAVPMSDPELRWREWTRRSSRQNAEIRMGGLVGCFDLPGSALEPFWPLLWLGQWTHAGKGCSMGLGRYVLEPLGEKNAAVKLADGAWPAPNRL